MTAETIIPETRKESTHPNEELETLSLLAASGVADEMTALLEHRDRQIEAIRRTSDALFSHPSVDAMIRATLQIALDVLRADAGTVFLHDSQNDTLVFRYVIGGGGESLIGKSIPADKGGVAWTVFRTHQPVLTGNVNERGDFNREVDKETGYQTQSMMTVPVRRTNSAPIGVMQVLNASVPFTQRDLEVLEVLCGQAATGIEHAQLLEDARNAEIGNRVGEIAHDIKNMMTPIQTGVMTLQPMLKDMFADLDRVRQMCPDNEEWGKHLEQAAGLVIFDYEWLLGDALTSAQRVRRRTEYIAGMVKGVLPPMVLEVRSVNEAGTEVAKTLRRVARERGVALQTEFADDVPPIPYDYDRLYDALYNLVNNAIPETPPGGSVTIRTRAPQSEGDPLLIQVQDTGRGIPEHVRVKLFTAATVSTKKGGTGLGTSVVARIVREHGGTITVDSEPGQGSIFTVCLPVRPADPSGE